MSPNSFFLSFVFLFLTWFSTLALAEPTAAENFFQQGMTAAESENYTNAIDFFNQAIQENAGYVEAHFHRGMAYLHKGDTVKALRDFDYVTQLNADFAPAYLGRAGIFFQEKKILESIAELDKALEKDPEFGMAYYNRGMAYYVNENYEKALDDLKRAEVLGIPVEPELAAELWVQTHPQEAIFELSKKITENPKDGRAYYNRGLVYQQVKEFKLALEDLEKAESLGEPVEPELLELVRSLNATA